MNPTLKDVQRCGLCLKFCGFVELPRLPIGTPQAQFSEHRQFTNLYNILNALLLFVLLISTKRNKKYFSLYLLQYLQSALCFFYFFVISLRFFTPSGVYLHIYKAYADANRFIFNFQLDSKDCINATANSSLCAQDHQHFILETLHISIL